MFVSYKLLKTAIRFIMAYEILYQDTNQVALRVNSAA